SLCRRDGFRVSWQASGGSGDRSVGRWGRPHRFKGPASVAVDSGRDKGFAAFGQAQDRAAAEDTENMAPLKVYLSTEAVDNSVGEHPALGKISRPYCIFIAMVKK